MYVEAGTLGQASPAEAIVGRKLVKGDFVSHLVYDTLKQAGYEEKGSVGFYRNLYIPEWRVYIERLPRFEVIQESGLHWSPQDRNDFAQYALSTKSNNLPRLGLPPGTLLEGLWYFPVHSMDERAKPFWKQMFTSALWFGAFFALPLVGAAGLGAIGGAVGAAAGAAGGAVSSAAGAIASWVGGSGVVASGFKWATNRAKEYASSQAAAAASQLVPRQPSFPSPGSLPSPGSTGAPTQAAAMSDQDMLLVAALAFLVLRS